MKKRILSFLTLLGMVIALLPMNPVYAATSLSCGDNLTWELNVNGTLTISGTGNMKSWGSKQYSTLVFIKNKNKNCSDR